MAISSRFVAFWNHPAGPKTIHFWAPSFKWGLVIAGLADIGRPAEKLSLTQSTALAATGIIWSRYSLVIIPKNYNLFSVNMFVAATGLYQLYRIFKRHRQCDTLASKQALSSHNSYRQSLSKAKETASSS